jgi:protein-L-isoaspartate O-methyltransferase
LLAQLEPGGRLVVPVAEHGSDVLTLFVRGEGPLDPAAGAGLERHVIAPCRFVPLLGEQGFEES